MNTIPAWIPTTHGTTHGLHTLVAEMPLVRLGGFNLLETALWLPNHHHRWWELHYVHRGRVDLELPLSGRSLTVRGGDFVLTRPGCVHRARDGIMAPAHLVWLQLNPRAARARQGSPFTAADLMAIQNGCEVRGDTAWTAPPQAAVCFRRLRELLAESADPLAQAGIRLAVAELILLAMAPAAVTSEPPALAIALAALAANPARPCTVAAAAAQARMSSARLHAWCIRHRGITPAAWQLGQRLDAARGPLAAGTPVNEVAADLGFSSPRYFAFAFRREVGVPPSLYAEAALAARTGPHLSW